jgi:hypothetical protein
VAVWCGLEGWRRWREGMCVGEEQETGFRFHFMAHLYQIDVVEWEGSCRS